MRIVVTRDVSTSRSVGSQVQVAAGTEALHSFCFGLEPPWDPTKTIKPRAVDPGTFEVKRQFSPHHNRVVPVVQNVPNFEMIEIHWGNFEFTHEGSDGRMHPPDSLGCLVVGQARGTDEVLTSMPIFLQLDELVKQAEEAGEEVTITYVNAWEGYQG